MSKAKILTKWLSALSLLLLFAGRSSAQSFTYSTTVSPNVCTSISTNSGVNLIDTHGDVTASCLAGGTDIVLFNTTTFSSSASAENVGPCGYTLTLNINGAPIVYNGTIGGTVSSTTANISTSITPSGEQIVQVGCTIFHVTINFIVPPPPPNNTTNQGAVGAHVVCEQVPGPMITCPPDVTLECPGNTDPGNTGTPTTTGGCGSVTLSHTDTTENLDCTLAGHAKTRITRVWTATDEGGQTASCTQTITIVDTTAPTLSGQGADATIECPATPTFTPPTASDLCDASPTITFTDVTTNLDCTLPGHAKQTVTRTWVATDSCGNVSAPVSQTITIVDTTPPVLSGCPDNTAVQCIGDVPGAATVTALDNCDGPVNVTLVETQSNPGSSCNNTITRVWTATDSCGNSSSCTQTITVNDTTAPNITNCPVAPIVIQLVSPNCDATNASVPLNVGATDNCDPNPVVTRSVLLPNGTTVDLSTLADPAVPGNFLFPIGTSTVTVTAVDACGNAATVCTFTVVVKPCQGGATRTQGFWATHVNALQAALAAGCFPSGLSCTGTLDINTLEAIFFAQVGQNCTGKRSPLGQARLKLAQQLIAAYANCCVLGTCPTTFNLSDALAALNGTNISLINSFQSLADAFNNSGDSIGLTPGQLTGVGPANPQQAKSLATKTASGCIDPGTCYQ